MVRFRSVQSGEVDVRAELIAVNKDRAARWDNMHNLYTDFRTGDHYGQIVARLEAGEPFRCSGWEIRKWVPWAGVYDYCIVEPDGTVRVVDRAEYMGTAVGASASRPKRPRESE